MFLHRALLLLLASLAHVVLCAEDYYKILGLDRQATDKQIKSAYRQLSKKYHPDKNPGDSTAESKFVEVSEAYEALIDPEARRVYDQYGHEGLKQHQQGGGGGGFHAHDPFDLFRSFFGGGGGFGGQPGQRRGPSVEVRVSLPLRDFYNGASHELRHERDRVCDECDGAGGELETCTTCGGHGRIVQRQMLVPGMYQQVQTTCHACGGRGQTVRHRCPACGGARVVRAATTLTLTVPRGAPRGARVTYEDEADAGPDHAPGDLYVVLTEADPALDEADARRADGDFFLRRGDDLFWREVLSLREAWMGGWTRNLTHLDGHVVRLGRPRGHVVQPGHVDRLGGEGMPKFHEDGDSVYHQTEYGSLYVEYVVVLPDQMDGAMEDEFRSVWDRWHGKIGVHLQQDSGRPDPDAAHAHEEL